MVLRNKGIVVAIENDNVLIELQSDNHSCTGCRGCTVQKTKILSVKNTEGIQKGNEVLIESCGGGLLKRGFLIFIVPVIFLFLGIFIVTILSIKTGYGYFLGSICGVALAFCILKLFFRNYLQNIKLTVIKKNSM